VAAVDRRGRTVFIAASDFFIDEYRPMEYKNH
jgi:hypothetical protein